MWYEMSWDRMPGTGTEVPTIGEFLAGNPVPHLVPDLHRLDGSLGRWVVDGRARSPPWRERKVVHLQIQAYESSTVDRKEMIHRAGFVVPGQLTFSWGLLSLSFVRLVVEIFFLASATVFSWNTLCQGKGSLSNRVDSWQECFYMKIVH